MFPFAEPESVSGSKRLACISVCSNCARAGPARLASLPYGVCHPLSLDQSGSANVLACRWQIRNGLMRTEPWRKIHVSRSPFDFHGKGQESPETSSTSSALSSHSAQSPRPALHESGRPKQPWAITGQVLKNPPHAMEALFDSCLTCGERHPDLLG